MKNNDFTLQKGPALDLPVIAIVGRPNVGKSSLFNAILRKRLAIVHFESGVTRDRVSAPGLHDGKRFLLIDTGGLGMYSGEKRKVGFWDSSIESQVEAALDSAETILFVVDVTCGLTELDKSIAERLRASAKRVIVVANKADNPGSAEGASEFHALGFQRVFPVSCLHRNGINPLMAETLRGVKREEHFQDEKEAGDSNANTPRALRIAVLGRPNVGKSSLVNRLLGENRVIVSDIAGTTRDAVDVDFMLECGDEQVPAVLVDTAGLRKKSKISEAVEHYSMMRSEEALNSCDIVLFLIEAPTEGSTSQDKTIARMITESGKGCIIVANKFDLCRGKKPEEFTADLHKSLPKMQYAPLLLASAKNGFQLKELYQLIGELRANMSMKVSTAMLNRVLTDLQEKNAPPLVGGRSFKIYYGTMVGNTPPLFSLFVNDPKLCTENYRLYIENYMRKAFAFTGFPLRIVFKARRREKLTDLLAKKNSGRKETAAYASAGEGESTPLRKVTPKTPSGKKPYMPAKGKAPRKRPASEGPVRSGKGRAAAAGKRVHAMRKNKKR